MSNIKKKVEKESNIKKRVILGLSGGVDSSVCAYLLKKDGYDVICIYMQNWDSVTNNDLLGNPTLDDEVCTQEKDFLDAKAVADKLELPLKRVDFIEDYWNRVFKYFLDEYNNGRTPNPDILCNNEIKFKAFIDYCDQNYEYDYIAMGHYAQVKKNNGKAVLTRAFDSNKDQTYFLCQLTEKQLSKVLFPIGNLEKKEVREIALKIDLITKDKKDSTGICFIGERNFAQFLKNYLPAKNGLMRKLDQTIVKEHHGLMNYTIGQRKGLGIGGNKDSQEPWFVVGKDLKTNTLYVEQDYYHPHLYSNKAVVKDIIFRGDRKKNIVKSVKFRYRQKDVEASLAWLNETTALITYLDKERAVTPGQACALYSDNHCLGGGFIDEVYFNEEKRQYS